MLNIVLCHEPCYVQYVKHLLIINSELHVPEYQHVTLKVLKLYKKVNLIF